MSLHHEVDGEGPPVVFIHAGICDSRSWEPQWRELREHYRVVRLDLPGFGQSPPSGPGADPVKAVATLLDELSVERASLVGASFGGRVAMELALARPELAEALVLIGASLPDHRWSRTVEEYGSEEDEALASGDVDRAVEANLRMWVDGPERSPGEVDAATRSAVAEMSRHALELQLAAGERMEEEPVVSDVGARLEEIRVPALVMVGELDVEDMRAIAVRLARELPNARLVTVPGAAHLPAMERPDAVTRSIADFLREVHRG